MKNSTTFLMAEEVLKEYLDKKITLDEEYSFRANGVAIDEIEKEETRVELGLLVTKALITIKILHRLLALKFDILCDGSKEEPVIVGSGYIYETVAKDLSNHNPSDILKIITFMADENGMMRLSAKEYDDIFKLMKDVFATGFNRICNAVFEIEHKMISYNDIEKGIRQVYMIMAHNDNILANFSCQGHVEPMVTNILENGRVVLEYKLDEPSIMIDYKNHIDMYKCVDESVAHLIETDHTFKKIHSTLKDGNVALEVRKLKSVSEKTWDDRVMLTFGYAGDDDNSSWSLKGPIDIMPGLYQTHGMMVCFITKLCAEIADRAK